MTAKQRIRHLKVTIRDGFMTDGQLKDELRICQVIIDTVDNFHKIYENSKHMYTEAFKKKCIKDLSELDKQKKYNQEIIDYFKK